MPDRDRVVAGYGGSFNPPHVGHAMVAQWVVWTGRADAVWFVPVYQHAFEGRHDKTLASFDQRVQEELVKHMIREKSGDGILMLACQDGIRRRATVRGTHPSGARVGYLFTHKMRGVARLVHERRKAGETRADGRRVGEGGEVGDGRLPRSIRLEPRRLRLVRVRVGARVRVRLEPRRLR